MARRTALLAPLLCGLAVSLAAGEDPADVARHMIAMSKGLDKLTQQLVWLDAGRERDKALPIAKQVFDLVTDVYGAQHDFTVTVMLSLAVRYMQLRDFDEAEKLFLRGLELRRKAVGDQHPKCVEALDALGTLYVEKGDLAQAEAFFRRALEGTRSWRRVGRAAAGPGDPDIARRLETLASLCYRNSRTDLALDLCKQALQIRETAPGGTPIETADCLLLLAALYRHSDRCDQAEPLCRRALDLYERALPPNDPRLSEPLEAMGLLFLDEGDLDKAEPFLRRALDACGGSHSRNRGVLRCMDPLAWVCRLKGDYAAALDLAVRSVTRSQLQNGPDHPDTIPFLDRLATLHAEMGARSTALDTVEEAWRIREAERNRIFAFATEGEQMAFAQKQGLQVSFGLALATERLAENPKARRFALELVLSTKSAVLDALARRQTALLGRPDPEMRRLLTAWRTAAAVLNDAALTPPKPGKEGARRQRLAELEQQKEQAEQALARASEPFARLREAERIGPADLARALPPGSALVEFARYFSCLPQELDARERLIVRYRVLRNMKLLRKDAVPPPGADDPPRPRDRTNWPREWRYVALVLRGRGQAGEPDPAVVPLGSAEAIDDAIAQWRRTVGPGRAGKLTDRPSLEAASAALAALVWKPLLPALGECRKVYLSPDGELAFASFGALPGREASRFLLEDWDIGYAATGRDLVRSPAGGGGRPLLVGAPDYGQAGAGPSPLASPAGAPDRSPARGIPLGAAPASPEAARPGLSDLRSFASLAFPPLPGTRAEVEAIARLLASRGETPRLLTGAEATEAALKSAPRPSILHLATHGFLLPDTGLDEWVSGEGLRGIGGLAPQFGSQDAAPAVLWRHVRLKNPMHRSGIALAGVNDTLWGRREAGGNDGLLTAEEVAGMNLWGTRLVAISACESGLGKARGGEGVFGLRRAFTLAGAQGLVMSLWSVSDEATRELMVALYRHMSAERSPQRALLLAQREWIARERAAGRYPHPFYWAAFVASGVGLGLE